MKKSKAMKVTERISKESLYHLRKIVGNYDTDPAMEPDELIGRICAHITGCFFKISPVEEPQHTGGPFACQLPESMCNPPLDSKPKDKPRRKRFKDYGTYMRSKEWRITRQDAIRTHLGQCDVCGAKDGLRVSHKHYRTLYEESPDDLDVLCADCHDNKYEGKVVAAYDPVTAEYLAMRL